MLTTLSYIAIGIGVLLAIEDSLGDYKKTKKKRNNKNQSLWANTKGPTLNQQSNSKNSYDESIWGHTKKSPFNKQSESRNSHDESIWNHTKKPTLNEESVLYEKINGPQSKKAFHSNFNSVPLLNQGEQKCFQLLNSKLKETLPTWHIFIQISMGEVIKSTDFDGFAVTNNKRYDFLISDDKFNAIAAIEYNGEGHFRRRWQDRDATKLIATEKAGISFIQIHYSEDISKKVDDIIQSIWNKTN